MNTTNKRSRRKTCQFCGGRNVVVNGVCEDCERERVYCDLCREWHPEDDPCRHVFWAPWGEFIGPGATYNMSSGTWEDVKTSVFAVLDKTDMAEALARTIEGGEFSIVFYGTIFGPDGLCCRLLNAGNPYTSDYGPRFTDGLTPEQEAAMSLGVGWLTGLYRGETVAANSRTLEWIAEYQAEHAKNRVVTA